MYDISQLEDSVQKSEGGFTGVFVGKPLTQEEYDVIMNEEN